MPVLRKHGVRSGVLAAAAGLLMAGSFPLVLPGMMHQVYPAGYLEFLAFVALVPLLAAVEAAPAWAAPMLGGLAGFVFFAALSYWLPHALKTYLGMSVTRAVALSLAIWGYLSVFWAGAVALSAWLRRRLRWPWVVLLPSVWVCAEFARAQFLGGMPWGNLGYSQARAFGLRQLAAVLGVHGLAALAVAVNCAVFELFASSIRVPRRLLAAATAVVLAVVAMAGAARERRLLRAIAAAPKVRVGLVQGNVDRAALRARDGYSAAVLNRYVEATTRVELGGADLVIWPEGAYPLQFPWVLETLRDAHPALADAKLQHAHVLLGVTGVVEEQGQTMEGNGLLLVDASLVIRDRYWKRRLVPLGERPLFGAVNRKKGRDANALRFSLEHEGAAVSVGALICFEAMFGELARPYHNVDFLVNPTNEAYLGVSSGPFQAFAMARLLAVETGKAVIRVGETGISGMALPAGDTGPLLGPRDLSAGPVAPELLVVEAPRMHEQTPYMRWGDMFAWSCCGYSGLLLLIGLRAGGRTDVPTTRRRHMRRKGMLAVVAAVGGLEGTLHSIGGTQQGRLRGRIPANCTPSAGTETGTPIG